VRFKKTGLILTIIDVAVFSFKMQRRTKKADCSTFIKNYIFYFRKEDIDLNLIKNTVVQSKYGPKTILKIKI